MAERLVTITLEEYKKLLKSDANSNALLHCLSDTAGLSYNRNYLCFNDVDICIVLKANYPVLYELWLDREIAREHEEDDE